MVSNTCTEEYTYLELVTFKKSSVIINLLHEKGFQFELNRMYYENEEERTLYGFI